MTEIKCTNCGKKLGEAKIQDGELQIKCKCGTVNTVKVEPENRFIAYTERVSKGLEKK